VRLGASACQRFRPVLLDFVDHREVAAGTGEALDHLSACDACARELELSAMVIVTLRRMREEVARVEPATDGWIRLRERVAKPQRRLLPFPSSIAGAMLTFAIVSLVGLRGGVIDGSLTAPQTFTSRPAPEGADMRGANGTVDLTLPSPTGEQAPIGVNGRRIVPEDGLPATRPILPATSLLTGGPPAGEAKGPQPSSTVVSRR
jgi:hypothetical protein